MARPTMVEQVTNPLESATKRVDEERKDVIKAQAKYIQSYKDLHQLYDQVEYTEDKAKRKMYKGQLRLKRKEFKKLSKALLIETSQYAEALYRRDRLESLANKISFEGESNGKDS